jgi:hypothetical protein
LVRAAIQEYIDRESETKKKAKRDKTRWSLCTLPGRQPDVPAVTFCSGFSGACCGSKDLGRFRIYSAAINKRWVPLNRAGLLGEPE